MLRLCRDRLECGGETLLVGENIAKMAPLLRCVQGAFGALLPGQVTRWEWTPAMHAMAVALGCEQARRPGQPEYRVGFANLLALRGVIKGLEGATLASLNNHFPHRLDKAELLRARNEPGTGWCVVWTPAADVSVELSEDLKRALLRPAPAAPNSSPPAGAGHGPEAVLPFSAGWADFDRFLGSEKIQLAARDTAVVIDVLAMSGRSLVSFQESFAQVHGRPKLLRVLVDALDGEVLSTFDNDEARDRARRNELSMVVRNYPAGLSCWLHGNRIGFSPRWVAGRGGQQRPDVIVEPLRLYLGARRPEGPNPYDPEYDVWAPESAGAGKWFNAFNAWFLKAWRASDKVELIFP